MVPTHLPAAGHAAGKRIEKGSAPLMETQDARAKSPHHSATPMAPHLEGAAVSPIQSALTWRSQTMEWQEILATIPTKQDITEMAASIVSTLTQEINSLKQQIDYTENRVEVVESGHTILSSKVTALETSNTVIQRQIQILQLQQDDAENRSRRNNVRQRGIPELIQGPELRSKITTIFNELLERPPTEAIEIDRVHMHPEV